MPCGTGKTKTIPLIADFRTFLKSELLKRLVAGRPITELPPVTEKLIAWVKWIEPMRQTLLEHKAQGYHIVVASGGLDLYLHELLERYPDRCAALHHRRH